MTQTATPGGTAGFDHMRMTIEEIVDGFAYGTDNFGRAVKVPVERQRAKGLAPQVGEVWIISKDLGVWTLAAIVGPPSVLTVTGSKASGAALESLLTTLSNLGVIIDGTTA